MLILLEEPNVIVLDEPGNDLDIDMLAALETLLDGWPGTLLIVTHDRYLMERTTDDQFAIIDHKVRHLPGGVEEYLRLVRGEKKPIAEPTSENVKQPSLAALRRDLQKELRSLEKRRQTAAENQAAAREKLATSDPSNYQALMEVQAALDELVVASDALDEQWLEVAERLEEVEASLQEGKGRL